MATAGPRSARLMRQPGPGRRAAGGGRLRLELVEVCLSGVNLLPQRQEVLLLDGAGRVVEVHRLSAARGDGVCLSRLPQGAQEFGESVLSCGRKARSPASPRHSPRARRAGRPSRASRWRRPSGRLRRASTCPGCTARCAPAAPGAAAGARLDRHRA
eukprot:5424703-Prymnesium_polylepis.2